MVNQVDIDNNEKRNITPLLRFSIFTILKLENLQLESTKIIKNNVQYCLREEQFTLIPPEKTKCVEPSEQVTQSLNGPASKFWILACASWAFAIFLFTLIFKLTFPYPFHASCLVKWDFAEPCPHVIQKLRSQILVWSDYKYCGSKCSYELYESKSYENNTIQALRISHKHNARDDIDIFLRNSSEGKCTVLAESISRNWYTIFDNGRNYCNLRDLVSGAEYDNRHYSEYTNNKICTQYGTAHCD